MSMFNFKYCSCSVLSHWNSLQYTDKIQNFPGAMLPDPQDSVHVSLNSTYFKNFLSNWPQTQQLISSINPVSQKVIATGSGYIYETCNSRV